MNKHRIEVYSNLTEGALILKKIITIGEFSPFAIFI